MLLAVLAIGATGVVFSAVVAAELLGLTVVGSIVEDEISVGVGVSTAYGSSVGVPIPVGVGISVGVGRSVAVGVGISVGVATSVGVASCVGVGEGSDGNGGALAATSVVSGIIPIIHTIDSVIISIIIPETAIYDDLELILYLILCISLSGCRMNTLP